MPKRDLTGLTALELRRLVGELRGLVVRLGEENAALKEEIARLKGHKGRPKIRPSGMERTTAPKAPAAKGKPAKRGKASRRVPEEEQVLAIAAPPGSRFKGYEDFVVQDLRLEARVIRSCGAVGPRRSGPQPRSTPTAVPRALADAGRAHPGADPDRARSGESALLFDLDHFSNRQLGPAD